ncbi:MAG TPA: ribosome maturation factor RimM [Vicinamibacterales bacterium]|nr:ribosome maturation factor RimM [Vicinamibacterales bacterium]HOQ60843.1 ribosome maturation factor RimM [Vicinamibacterales bacterium]
MSADWDDLVLVARVARPHGRRGEVILNPETDFPEIRFAPGAAVLVRRGASPERLIVRSVWFMKARPVVGFEGFDSIDDAETLGGRELRIPAEQLAALPPGMFYRHDLVGCLVETTGGEAVGEVAGVEGDGAASRLVVRTPRGEALVPLAAELCPVVDPQARRIVIDAPDGLLALNETARSRRERRERRP